MALPIKASSPPPVARADPVHTETPWAAYQGAETPESTLWRLVRARDQQGVEATFRRLKQRGKVPPLEAYHAMLQMCANTRDHGRAVALFEEARLAGLKLTAISYLMLVDALWRPSPLSAMRYVREMATDPELMRQSPRMVVVVLARVMSRKDHEETYEAYMKRVDEIMGIVTSCQLEETPGLYSALVKARAYLAEEAPKALEEVLLRAKRAGFTPRDDPALAEGCLRVLARMRDSEALLEKFLTENNIEESFLAWQRSTLESGPHSTPMSRLTPTLVRLATSYARAQELFTASRRAGWLPDAGAYHALLVALAKDTTVPPDQQWLEATALLREMNGAGLRVHTHSWSVLAGLMTAAGLPWQGALGYLQEVEPRDHLRVFLAVLRALAHRRESCWPVWQRMLQLEVEPNEEAVMLTVQSCTNTDHRDIAHTDTSRIEAISAYLLAKRFPMTIRLACTLAAARSATGNVDETSRFLASVLEGAFPLSTFHVNRLLQPLARDPLMYVLVPKLVAQMESRGLEPNLFTFNTLLYSLSRRPDWDAALEVFDRMRERGVQPDVASWCALLLTVEQDKSLDWATAEQRSSFVRSMWRAHNECADYNAFSGNIMLQIFSRFPEGMDHFHRLLKSMQKSDDPAAMANSITFLLGMRLHSAQSVVRGLKFLQESIELTCAKHERGIAVVWPSRSTIEECLTMALIEGHAHRVREFMAFALRHPYPGSLRIPPEVLDDEGNEFD